MKIQQVIMGMCFLIASPSIFAHGGAGLETAVIWFYTLLVIMHGTLVLLFRNMMLYNYLWLVILSVCFSIGALIVWGMLLAIIKAMSHNTLLMIASYIGLIIHFVIAVWAIQTPIKQYLFLKKDALLKMNK